MDAVWEIVIVLGRTEPPLKCSSAAAGMSHFVYVNSCPEIEHVAMVMGVAGGRRWRILPVLRKRKFRKKPVKNP